MDTTFIKYIASLTGKERPKICYVPTASADNPYGIIRWYEKCRDLDVKPYVLKIWVSSYTDKQPFADFLLGMDAIVVGGGNTLNMMAIWKAQGIDTVLTEAYKQGIVLAGGSAGSLCWFVEGSTDSRPGKLTTVKGLGLLKYSHSPHYSSEGPRRPMYRKMIEKGIYLPGYALDNRAGIVFKYGKFAKAVTLNEENHAYFVTVKNGKAVEKELPAEIVGNGDTSVK
ncbi:MAG: peptidase E [Chlorobi bacterium]|nr:peptidase E [Chlorobiota bacterium]